MRLGIEPPVSIWLGPWWVTELVWALRRRDIFLTIDRNQTMIPQKRSLQPNTCKCIEYSTSAGFKNTVKWFKHPEWQKKSNISKPHKMESYQIDRSRQRPKHRQTAIHITAFTENSQFLTRLFFTEKFSARTEQLCSTCSIQRYQLTAFYYSIRSIRNTSFNM
jgi:hypothetical protein